MFQKYVPWGKQDVLTCEREGSHFRLSLTFPAEIPWQAEAMREASFPPKHISAQGYVISTFFVLLVVFPVRKWGQFAQLVAVRLAALKDRDTRV